MASLAHLNTAELLAVRELKRRITTRFQLLDLKVFGSKVRGDAAPDSDIDVMIKLAEGSPAILSSVHDMVFEINLEHDVFISATLFTRQEIEQGPMSESPLYKVVEREGVAL
jgi:predicted nucleotidyltransferase